MVGILFIVVLMVIPALIMMVCALTQYNDIDKNGLCAQAVVLENEQYTPHQYRAYSGETHARYKTTVQYTDDKGKVHQTELWHSDGFEVGAVITVKYVPGKYDRVMPVHESNEC